MKVMLEVFSGLCGDPKSHRGVENIGGLLSRSGVCIHHVR